MDDARMGAQFRCICNRQSITLRTDRFKHGSFARAQGSEPRSFSPCAKKARPAGRATRSKDESRLVERLTKLYEVRRSPATLKSAIQHHLAPPETGDQVRLDHSSSLCNPANSSACDRSESSQSKATELTHLA